MIKKRRIILALLILSLIYFSYSQLFKQPELVEGNFIELKNVFTHHTDDVWDVKFSPNDSLLVSSGLENEAIILSRVTGKVIHRLPHDIGIPSVDFSPDGSTVCTGSYDGKVRIWNSNTGDLANIIEGNGSSILSVDYSPSMKFIAAGEDNGVVSIWNLNTSELLHEFNDTKRSVWEVMFNPTGELLLTSSSDNTIRVYNVQTGKLLKTLLGHSMVPLSMDFSPNGALLATGSDDKTVKIWDTKTWELLHDLKGENEAIHSVVFLDNERVIAGGTDKKMLGELLEYHFNFTGYTEPIIATLWNIKREEIIQTITQHSDDLETCSISFDGNWLATASKDQNIKIWKIHK